MKKILVVDDTLTNRILLKQTLAALGDYEVIEAVSGKEAISQFKKEKPDLILMDIMMPDMDGCEATAAIKSDMGDDHTPIIFVTALSAESSLATALATGGDDFISKPFHVDVLNSKIIAHLRIRELNQQLNAKNNLLLGYNQQLENEQGLIEHFFEHAIQQSFLDDDIIKYHMSSMSTFNGDLLLTERGPEGGLYLVMGDFSGHGLTAAMGTLPVAMIFFKMVHENAAVGDIAREINLQLYKLMPHNMFFVASILELSSRGDVMSIWTGGMPESYWLSKDGQLKGLIHARHMPLGILSDEEFSSSTQVLNIENEDKIYLYSDGVIEALNPEGEQFGEQRLNDVLIAEGDNRFNEILNTLNKFTGENSQNDDITLIELNCRAIPAAQDIEEKGIDAALLWDISVSLSAKDMRIDNPVGKLSDIVSSMPFVTRHKGALHVLLFEVYMNALDHSILNIESSNKNDENNFSGYYEKREEKLKELKEAFIDFNFNFIVKENNHYLKINVKDSGCGYKETNNELAGEMLHGRGLNIINSFCEDVTFSDDGKTLELLYRL